jgi:hypothetical protein
MVTAGILSGVSGGASLAAQSAAPALPKPAQASGSGQDLSSQATDPTASLMAINLISDFKASYWDTNGGGYEFRFQPVIPFKAWGANNILRVVVPYQGSGPGDEGLKSVTVFDIIVVPRKWGRLAIGPVMNFSESAGDAPSKFAIGPAVGVVVPRSPRLNIGVFTQNLFASGVGITQLQPIVAYQLGQGWALSAGDLQFTYDWEREEWVDVPVGFQLGVVKPIAGQPLRWAVNPQWNLKNIAGADKAKVVFTVTLLVPGG